MSQKIRSDLLDTNGKKIGTVHITQNENGTIIYDEISIDDPEAIQKIIIGEDKPLSMEVKVNNSNKKEN